MLQDIELLESGSILKGLRFPHKITKVTQIVITAGQFTCLVDFRMWARKLLQSLFSCQVRWSSLLNLMKISPGSVWS